MNALTQLAPHTQSRLLIAHLLTQAPASEALSAGGMFGAAPLAHVAPNPYAHLLLIDEDAAFIDKARRWAEQSLVRTHQVAGVEGALAELDARGAQIDLILLNLDTPAAAAGDDLVARVRAHPQGAQIPLAVMARGATLTQRARAARMGVRLLLDKPVDSAAFNQAIHQLVGLRRGHSRRILLLEADAPRASRLLETLQAAAFECTWLTRADDLLGQLERTNPQALLLNPQMTPVHGFDLCRVLRTTPRWQDLPVILLSARDDLPTRMQAWEAGADDFMSVQVSPPELLARLQTHIARARLMRQRADRDPLTGLMTRRIFLELLSARLSEVRRSAQPLAFCLLDLDHFKRINDTHGHPAGDRVLAALGKLLQAQFRAQDLRARWGGEEFVVALVNEQAGVARRVLERIQLELGRIDFEGSHGQTFRASFSAGIVQFPDHGQDIDQLLQGADSLLYAAKAAGRSQVIHAGQQRTN